jgi:hypothetical protein
MKTKKIKIGIVGENPQNDSDAMRTLLLPKAKEHIQFKVILKNLYGSDFDDEQNGGASKKFLRLLKKEIETEDLSFVIFLRDADEKVNEQILNFLHKKDAWFKQANKEIQQKGIFFLIIAELEALIISDIENVNQFFTTHISYSKNPLYENKPKEFLMQKTDKSKRGRYQEKDAADILKKLDFHKIYQNHKGKRSFQDFADELKCKDLIDF